MIQLLGQMWNWIKNFTDLELRYLLKRMKAKYYVIIRSEGGAGFFSNYFWVMGHVAFAEKMGYIPVVDMENYPTLYSEEEPVDGTNNAWNYYFENIGNLGLDEVYASGRYVIGKDKYLTKYAEKYSMFPYRYPSERMIAYYAPIIKKNLRIKQSLVNEYKREWIEKTSGSNNILGIHIRGTDMKNNLGHPMPAPVSEYIRRTHEMLEKHPDISRIFLATDENEVKEAYEREFEGSAATLFMNEAFRAWDDGQMKKTGLHEMKIDNPRPRHKYLLGKEVLRDAWFLSRCQYLLCGHSNITNVAILWNEGRYNEVVCIESDQ